MLTVVAAGLAFAPSAFASTVTSGEPLTIVGDPALYQHWHFDDSAGGGSVNVDFFSDPAMGTLPTNCTDTDGDPAEPHNSITCTGVSSIVTQSGNNDSDINDNEGLATTPITATGGDGSDDLYGSDANDELSGGDGNDYIEANGGDDVADGQAGDDSVYGDQTCNCPPAGNDTVRGGDGQDDVHGGPGDDNVDGGAGDDSEVGGGPGNDTVSAGDGNDDNVRGGPGNDTVDGGAGDDNDVEGQEGNDTVRGGTGDDNVYGQEGNDNVDAGAGDDGDVGGGPGNDTINGGDGNDNNIRGGPGADNVNGGGGDDFITDGDDGMITDYQPDVVRGGDGYDVLEVDHACSNNDQVAISLDDKANDGFTGGPGGCTGQDDANNNYASDIEGLSVYTGNTPLKITASAQANQISTCCGPDEVDLQAGSDSAYTNDGADVVNAVDGYPDFIDCGDGNDTANVDQFDTTARCEVVNRSTVQSAFQTPEDAPPSVAWTSPPPGSKSIPSATPTRLEVSAADDKGVAKVDFYVGSRVVCTDTAAPYTCDYLPVGADIGRNTLTAIATDTAGQTASALNQVVVPRFTATSLSSRTRPARDTSNPRVFTTAGRLALPGNVTAAQGCSGGTVTIQFRAAKRTISSRRVGLKKDCTFSSKVRFQIPSRIVAKRLEVLTRFNGNEVMNGRSATRHRVTVHS
jgi:Ca2+-binding RTX toxin-like protein